MDKRYAMLIEALDGTVKDLRRLTKPVGEPDALRRPAPDAWCVKDVLAHLSDIEPQMRARYVRILEQDNPHEPFINPNPAAHNLAAPCAELIDAFDAERKQTTALLATLTQPQWLRICTHDTFGVTRLRKQVEVLIGHDNEHLAQLVEIREFLTS
jgi:hypothetical protein